MASTERKLAAIMFTDIVGYTAAMAKSEERGLRVRERHRQLVQPLVEQHHGESVEARGDESLSLFSSALDAVNCALAIQERLRDDAELSLHLGIHMGDVVLQAGEVSGDGVNIASRICSISENGGLYVSGEVYQAVRNQPGIEAVSLGEHELKNVGRPVAVYRVTGKAEPPRVAEDLALPGMDDLTVPGFGGAPAIAVLPFDNLSGDPDQEYFADGIAEELITRLSSWRYYPVIARNSSFVYRGRAVDAKEVSRELGARYLVEGSVQKAGDRVRISAQLIDATKGHHVWAETYDRELRDIFALQDEITEAIVGSINPAVEWAERARVARKEPRNLGAYDLAMRGLSHLSKFTREENAEARSLFKQAIELDSESSLAFRGLAWTHWDDAAFQWSETPAESASELIRAAQRGVALDANSPRAQLTLSLAYFLARQPDEMIAAAERAVELDPSYAMAHAWLGVFLAGQGRLEEGLANAEKAIRLSPRDPQLWLLFWASAYVHFQAHQYEDAVEWARRSIREHPGFAHIRAILAASYGHLGRVDEARTAVEELLRVQPGFSLTFVTGFDPLAPAHLDHYLDGLRKAGLPEE